MDPHSLLGHTHASTESSLILWLALQICLRGMMGDEGALFQDIEMIVEKMKEPNNHGWISVRVPFS